jgi:hypothetical protein
VEVGLLLPRISECYYGFRSTRHRKKDDRNNENSEQGVGKFEYLYEVVAVGDASAALTVPIFHFGEISISEAKTYLKGRAIPVKI